DHAGHALGAQLGCPEPSATVVAVGERERPRRDAHRREQGAHFAVAGEVGRGAGRAIATYFEPLERGHARSIVDQEREAAVAPLDARAAPIEPRMVEVSDGRALA